jgi:restriction endonuclease S subunit
MDVKLDDLVKISTGVYDKPTISGNVIYLQAGMYEAGGSLREGIEPNILMDDLTSKHILLHGDVLFNAKGTNNFAVTYDTRVGPAVASSTFLVIRPKPDTANRMLPGYLAWYLNHPQAQGYLKAQAMGTSIPSITKSTLQELTIPLPNLPTQERILNVYRLRQRQKELVQQLETLRDQLIQHTLLTKAQQ